MGNPSTWACDLGRFSDPDVGRSIAPAWRTTDPRATYFRGLSARVRETASIRAELNRTGVSPAGRAAVLA
jgi:hypothetical protein